MPVTSPLDALVEELAIVAGRIERESSLRIDAIVADLRRVDAEREVRLANLERTVAGRLAAIKDGADADPALIARMVDEAVAKLPPAVPGKDADPVAVAALVAENVDRAIADLPSPKDGADADPALIARMVDEAVAKLPPAAPGKDGKLPIVREWADEIHYEGAVVVHEGATYQARKDTARVPPHADWVCMARAGRDGDAGRSFKIMGTFDPEKSDYHELNVVVLNGASFAARRDKPGVCPGDGWQLLASQGKRGLPGEARKGDPGRAGAAVQRIEIDGDGMLLLVNGDGTSVTCDLYPLLSKLQG